tara:strand:+ start:254 stop:469 length:216 start_codon:yes stop_codon:yes gene_type:complete
LEIVLQAHYKSRLTSKAWVPFLPKAPFGKLLNTPFINRVNSFSVLYENVPLLGPIIFKTDAYGFIEPNSVN